MIACAGQQVYAPRYRTNRGVAVSRLSHKEALHWRQLGGSSFTGMNQHGDGPRTGANFRVCALETRNETRSRLYSPNSSCVSGFVA
jgi:hypothetical protein